MITLFHAAKTGSFALVRWIFCVSAPVCLLAAAVQSIVALGLLVLFAHAARAQWVQTNGPGGGNIWALAISGSNIFAGTAGGGVFLSTDNGTSWTAVNSGLTDNTVWSLAVNGKNIFAGTLGRGVFLSTNNGANWTAANSGLPSQEIYTPPAYDEIFDPIQSLAMCGSNVLAGTAGLIRSGIFLSTSNGTSWTQVESGRTAYVGVQSFAVSGSSVFAGTGSGVFLSTNNGTSWSAVNTDLTDTVIWSLAVSGSNIFAGTYGNGAWRCPLSQLLAINDHPRPAMSKSQGLTIRTPNFTRRSVEIDFTIPNLSFVTIAVYDLSGHIIAALVNQTFSPGSHSLSWDTRNVAAGFCAVRMQAGGNAFVKRVPILQ
jgi:hypothetical protein